MDRVVVLPRHLDLGPHYEYDLAADADVLLTFERVIRETQTPNHFGREFERERRLELLRPARNG
ncbi:hypothetical protein VR43_03190 [Streptomyces sp. NRRL S-104]|nr:hypothetical protein VR43_03190 [Streptomyces sp. NRRL S-104]